MSGIFQIDSPLMRVLNKISDVIILGVVWLLSCIPIVTIGAATTAAYYAFTKVIRRERGSLLKEYGKSFIQNFKDSFFINLILVALQILLSYNIYVTFNSFMEEDSGILFNMLVAYVTLMVIFIALSFFTYALLSRFTMKGWKLFKFAMFATFRNFHWALVIVLCFALSVFLIGTLPILVVFVPGLFLLAYSYFLEKVLRKYMTKEMLAAWDGTGEENNDLPNMADVDR